MKPELLGSEEFWKRLTEDPKALAAEVCFIDLTRLDETLQKHAATYAWVNAAHENARVEEEHAKWELTKARATALLKAQHPKKTIPVINAEVEVHPAVESATGWLLEAQRRRGALRAMATGLDKRTDMLVQLSARQRKEMTNY